MAPHDSDSSGDEQDEYTETNVLLGYASKEPEDISRLGGRPEWIDPETPPSAALARCGACGDLMVLLLQLNAELPADFPGHERRLYVFACRRKTCRRKQGSIRALRGVRVEPGAGSNSNAKATTTSTTTAGADDKKENGRRKENEKREEEEVEPKPPVPNLGETLFGATTLGSSSSGSANPFSMSGSGSTSTSTSNPFASPNTFSSNNNNNGTPAAAPATADSKSNTDPPPDSNGTQDQVQKEIQLLPKTFAETLSLNNPQSTPTNPTPTTAPAPPEPWPPESEQPRPYPVSYLTDAEYETLDPTPAPVSQATVQMDVDEPSPSSSSKAGAGKGKSKEDRDVFESSMDAAFQKFADRLAQNPEQAIRYEFGGQPLLYSRADAVGLLLLGGKDGISGGGGGGGMPRCGNCGARRLFEVQLCPNAIAELEADELSLEGMDWGTVIVGVCERDCLPRGLADGAAGYLEEWAGVQWEELTGTGGRR